jgi:hypothetical protein
MSANVISFDMNKRHDATTQRQKRSAAKRLARMKRAEAAETKRVAGALGIPEGDVTADVYLNFAAIEAVEAAYATSVAEGRSALLARLSEIFEDGHAAGLDDASLPIAAGTY